MLRRVGMSCYLLFLVFGLWLFYWWFHGAFMTRPPSQPSYKVVVEEDDPGWDCRVMGNRKCG